MVILKLRLSVFVNFLSVTLITSQEGEICTLRTGLTGTCRIIPDCKEAIEQYRRNESPIRCGFQTTSPYHEIVCCSQPTTSRPANLVSAVRISQKKCKEYSTGLQIWVGITGGEDARPKEFPHMALLGFGSEANTTWGCGGTLVSERFVLTAAHCLFSPEFGSVKKVRLGELVLDTDTDYAQPIDIPIDRVHKHPDRDGTKYNDIALIRLRDQVTINDFVRPACLPTKFFVNTSVEALATGWGQSEWGGGLNKNLLKVRLYFTSHQKCLDDYTDPDERLPLGILEETQVCAGSNDPDVVRDTCPGDSGGPIQISHDTITNMYTIVGVTSFGKGCGGGLGVYTRIFPYLNWIERTIWSTNE